MGTQSTLSIIAVAPDGSLAINDSQNGVIQLDISGSASQVTSSVGGVPKYSWTVDWSAQGPQGESGVALPLDVDPSSWWAGPGGNASSNNWAFLPCPCEVQSTGTGSSQLRLPGTTGPVFAVDHLTRQQSQVSSLGNPFKPAPDPRSGGHLLTTAYHLAMESNSFMTRLGMGAFSKPEPQGGQTTDLLLVGDPGGTGNDFEDAAWTEGTALANSGDNIIEGGLSTSFPENPPYFVRVNSVSSTASGYYSIATALTNSGPNWTCLLFHAWWD